MAHSTETDSITPERRSEIGPDNAAVRALLARLARAVTSGDGEAAAATWATPALVLGDDMALTVSSSTDIRDVFGSAKAQYNARGIADTRPDIRGDAIPGAEIDIGVDEAGGRIKLAPIAPPVAAAERADPLERRGEAVIDGDVGPKHVE